MFRLLIPWKAVIRCVAISGIAEDLWTEENEKAVDEFIEDTSITLMVVYKDAYLALRVEHAMPLQVTSSLSVTGLDAVLSF